MVNIKRKRVMSRSRSKARKVAKVPTQRYRHKPLGRSAKAVHVYSETLQTLNPGIGGTIATYNISANGLYDPNLTGVGHQPMGFDQMAALFNHYTVTKAKIRVTFVNEDANYAQLAGIRIAASATACTDFSQFIELSSNKWVVVGDFGSGDEQKTITLDCPIGSWLGRPDVLSEDDLRGDSTANPTEEIVFQIAVQPVQAVDSGRVDMCFEVIYETVWTEPRLTTPS